MTVPYTPAAVAQIQSLLRARITPATICASLGWSAHLLLSVCRRHNIDLPPVWGEAAVKPQLPPFAAPTMAPRQPIAREHKFVHITFTLNEECHRRTNALAIGKGCSRKQALGEIVMSMLSHANELSSRTPIAPRHYFARACLLRHDWERLAQEAARHGASGLGPFCAALCELWVLRGED